MKHKKLRRRPRVSYWEPWPLAHPHVALLQDMWIAQRVTRTTPMPRTTYQGSNYAYCMGFNEQVRRVVTYMRDHNEEDAV